MVTQKCIPPKQSLSGAACAEAVAAEAERFCDMDGMCISARIKVCERPGKAERPVITAGGQAVRFRSLLQKAHALSIESTKLFQQCGWASRVCRDDIVANDGISPSLDRPSHGDPLGDICACFAGRRESKIGRFHRRHRDLNIEAIPERSRNSCPVAFLALGPGLQVMPGVQAWPQRHGFIAATSWKREGYRMR